MVKELRYYIYDKQILFISINISNYSRLFRHFKIYIRTFLYYYILCVWVYSVNLSLWRSIVYENILIYILYIIRESSVVEM